MKARSSFDEGSKTLQYHKEIQRVKALIEKGDLAGTFCLFVYIYGNIIYVTSSIY